MQGLKTSHHLYTQAPYNQVLHLEEEVRIELRWWLHHMAAWNGRAIFSQTLNSVL